MEWNFYLNFLAAMLGIVNPIGIVPMWSELTSDASKKVRRQVAYMLVGTAIIILLIFLITGKYVLSFFSIDLAVFKVAGGILLLTAGISMVNGSATSLKSRDEEGETAFQLAKKRFKKILVPMAIPRLSGPGSITTVILFGSNANNFNNYVFLSITLVITLIILLIVFIYSDKLEKNIDNLVFTIFTRLFGIIVTAIAVQFIVEGLGKVFPNWMEGASELEKSKNKGKGSE